jgi:hypothetical protein
MYQPQLSVHLIVLASQFFNREENYRNVQFSYLFYAKTGTIISLELNFIVNVSRLPFGGLEAEVSIVEKTMVTMER